MDFNQYNYNVEWSDEDELYIGRVEEFSLLAAHGDTEGEALKEIQFAVKSVLEILEETGEEIPQPLVK